MATKLYKDTTYSVYQLVQDILKGAVALPDIQRPFVWEDRKVRDLFDSMYKGFPVGHLLFWETGAEPGAKQIGMGDKEAAARLLIVDGQQRLTSLYSVISGQPIVRQDYRESGLKLAFRPKDATFAVPDATTVKDPEFIPDISQLWVPGQRKQVVRSFLDRLASKRELSDEERDSLDEAIDLLYELRNYDFKAVELAAEVDEEQVAEIFVRINSEGVKLSQADFILTLLSVFWEEGRVNLENFARDCMRPTVSQASPFNWFIRPSPAQMLRVSVAVAFRRAVLRHVYTLLRGKDVDTGKIDPARREEQFERLKAANERVLDLTNWHEFLQSIERAGFRGSKLISGENALLFTYALWLIGLTDYNVPRNELRELMACWFFMAQTTGRYTGSFETKFEEDVARLRDLDPGDAEGFVRTLNQVLTATLTNDFWEITLPDSLGTSAPKSPALLAYIASLNILDADALLSTSKVRIRLDPAITTKKGIERHHLFPRAYLKSRLGVKDVKQINQIANMALVEWVDNLDISDSPPAEYWPEQVAARGLPDEVLERQRRWHALPEGWEHMAYPEFLRARQKLMAKVVKDAYIKLSESSYTPVYPTPNVAYQSTQVSTRPRTTYKVTVADLLEADLLAPGNTLVATVGGTDVYATVIHGGRIAFGDAIHETPSSASDAAALMSTNGWSFWSAVTDEGVIRLADLRERYIQSTS